MTKKVDLRIRKTKSNLYKSLLKLMQEKEFEDIRVSDICTDAHINRSTFYDHFNDKYELLLACMKELQNDLVSRLKIDTKTTTIKDFYFELLMVLSDYVEKNMKLYSSLSIIKYNFHSIAYDMMLDALQEAVLNRLNTYYTNTSNIPNEVVALFYVSGAAKLMTNVIKDPSLCTAEEFINYLDQLIPDLNYIIPKKIET